MSHENINPLLAKARERENVHILVFKTNIRFKKDLKVIGSLLKEIASVLHWNFDGEDIDNILRIESSSCDATQIINLITKGGYFCEELAD